MVKTSKIYVRDSSAVSPLAIMLFGGVMRVEHFPSQSIVKVDDWARLVWCVVRAAL